MRSRHSLPHQRSLSPPLVAFSIYAAVVFGVLGLPLFALGATDVLMRQYDVERTGTNIKETELTPAAVASGNFRKLFELAVDEKLDTQPLVVRDVPMPDGTRDIILAATMNNRVFAFDFLSGKPAWTSAQLAVPVPDDGRFDMWGTNTNWGILSTPVIDRATLEMYLVTWGLENGSPVYRLHVLDLRTGVAKSLGAGAQSADSIVLGGTIRYTDRAGEPASLAFNPSRQKQRPALLLETVPTAAGPRHVLYIAFGAIGEKLAASGGPAANSHGWLIAYDLADLHALGSAARGSLWCSTPRVGDGGFWQAGSGIAGDGSGDVFALTGNGSFDGVTDFSESFVRLRYIRKPSGAARLKLIDWFTAFRDSDRQADGDHQDRDLGSAGPLVLQRLNLVVGGGKDGILYVVRRGNFGHLDRGALAQPPFVASYTPAAGTDPVATPDLAMPDDKSHHIHGAPAYWEADGVGPMLYLWGENEMLRAFRFDGKAFVLAAIASTAERASKNMPPPGGMPGGFISVSANAGDPATGVVWATAPRTGDANMGRDSNDGKTVFVAPGNSVGGILRAYDAVHFDTLPDGRHQLHLLWDSEQRSGDSYGLFANFTPPTVANGRVIVPTFGKKLVVYGIVSQ